MSATTTYLIVLYAILTVGFWPATADAGCTPESPYPQNKVCNRHGYVVKVPQGTYNDIANNQTVADLETCAESCTERYGTVASDLKKTNWGC